MKRIFLDTNILINYIDNREGADAAEQIFALGFSGEGRERECLELLKNDYQPQAVFLRSAKNMPRRIKTVPNRNQRVICSLSIHQAKTIVVRGLK